MAIPSGGGPSRAPVPTPRSVATQVPAGILGSSKATAPVKAAAPTAHAPVGNGLPPGYLTPAEMAAQSIAQARAEQLPQLQAINQQAAQSKAQAASGALSTQDAYKALASILQGVAPAVGQAYQSAAMDQDALARGFSDGLSHVQSQAGDQTNQILNVSGGQQQAPQAIGALGGTGATNALYDLGGYIPASTMLREGAGFQSAAAQLPATAAGTALENIRGIIAKQAQDQQGFGQQRTDLAAQIPGLANTAKSQLESYQNTALNNANNLALKAQSARNLAQYRQNTVSERAQNDKLKGQLAAQSLAQKGQLAQEGLTLKEAQAAEKKVMDTLTHQDRQSQLTIEQISATGMNPDGTFTVRGRSEWASAFGYDPVTGKPTASTTKSIAEIAQGNARISQGDARIAIEQNRAATARFNAETSRYKATLSKQPKPTYNEIQTYKASASSIAENSFKGSVQSAKTPAFSSTTKGDPNGWSEQNGTTYINHYPPIDYNTALDHMIQSKVPLGLALSNLNKWFKTPGERGRPATKAQLAKIRAKAYYVPRPVASPVVITKLPGG